MPSTINGAVNGAHHIEDVAANRDVLYKGLSFTPEERISKNLTGLIPHTMESLQTQSERAMRMINTRQTDIDKYLYLSSLKEQNVDLFYRLLIDNIRELMPLVYTPTIGDVCLQYSTLYTRPEALYISIKQRKSIRTMLKNWPYPHPEICVVTDGSRILGLGDLGLNGVGISVSSRPSFPQRHAPHAACLHIIITHSGRPASRGRSTHGRPGILAAPGRPWCPQTSHSSPCGLGMPLPPPAFLLRRIV
jgi:hypothetical protein